METPAATVSNQRYHYAVLALLLLAGWWLRVDGNDWGLPFRLHPDEMKYVAPGARVHEGVWNPKYFRNPPGFSYLNAAWFPFWMSVGSPVEVPEWMGVPPSRLESTASIPATLYYRPFDLVLGARHLAALLGTIGVLLVFLIGKDAWGNKAGLLAAAMHAASFIGVRESHFAVNDTAATLFILLSAWLGLRMLRGRAQGYLLASAALGGAAVAMKYNAFPVVVALVLFRLLFYHRKSEPVPWSRWALESVLIGTVAVVVFLLICPFPLSDPGTFRAEMEDLARKSSQTWPGQETTWSGFLLLESLAVSEGILGCLLAAIGAVLLYRRRNREMLVFPALYTVLVCTHSLFFMRFALPVLPWISLCAAPAILWLGESRRMKTSYALPVVVLLALFTMLEPFAKDLRGNYLFNQTDTRVELVKWLRTENDVRARIAVDQYAIPLIYRGAAEPWGSLPDPRLVPIDQLPTGELRQLDTLTDLPVGQIAVSSFAAFPGILPDTFEERRAALMQYLNSAEPVKVFQPFTEDWIPQASDVEDTYNPVTDLWSRNHPGPVIEVFSRNILLAE